jgi:flavin-dependent dehydrogenase
MGATRNPDTDLLVIGGGPAGLATAIRARQAGLSVRLIDRARPPIDKACGEGVMPDGVAMLRQLGVEPAPAGMTPFRGIRYIDGDLIAEGLFAGSAGWGIRRLFLHQALVERAEELGVDLNWNVTAMGLSDGVTTDRGVFTSRWIAAADGLHSRARRWAALEGRAARRRRYGVRRHFLIDHWTDLVEVHWADRCEAYVTPVGPGRVDVALLWSRGKPRFDELLTSFPTLRRRLAGARVDSEDRGAGPLEQRVKAVVRGNLALIGDASGYLDAISGEGLSLSLHQAFALVEALEHDDLRAYAASHRRIRRLPGTMTRLLLVAEVRPWLRRRVVGALARDGELFSRMVSVTARELSPLRLGSDGIRLIWQIARRSAA